MKKIIVFIVLYLSQLQTGLSQNYSDSLIKHCRFSVAAEFILRNSSSLHTPNMEMVEYNQDIDGQNLYAGMAFLYISGYVVELNKIANDLWLLISNQLHGENGQLTLTKINFIPTMNESKEFVMIVALWNKEKRKWDIMSLPFRKVKTLYKGARMFAPKVPKD